MGSFCFQRVGRLHQERDGTQCGKLGVGHQLLESIQPYRFVSGLLTLSFCQHRLAGWLCLLE